MTGDGSKLQCCKEKYCIGTCNAGSTNQGKLQVLKQEIVRMNIDILGISELKWTGMGDFSSVQFSRSVVSDSLRPHELQHARPPCPSPTPEFTQIHNHRVGDAIQPSHPLLSPSPPAPNP